MTNDLPVLQGINDISESNMRSNFFCFERVVLKSTGFDDFKLSLGEDASSSENRSTGCRRRRRVREVEKSDHPESKGKGTLYSNKRL